MSKNTSGSATYAPRPIRAPVVLFRAEDQRHHLELRLDPTAALPLDLGWGPLSAAGVAVHEAAGEHMSMIFGAHAAPLGARVEAAIAGLLS